MNADGTTRPADSCRYEVRLAGQLDERWSDWFEGFTLTNEVGGTATLTGPVLDQAALHGLLRRVSDLGITLISVDVLDSILPVTGTIPRGSRRHPTAD
jgi:hypothetical protein